MPSVREVIRRMAPAGLNPKEVAFRRIVISVLPAEYIPLCTNMQVPGLAVVLRNLPFEPVGDTGRQTERDGGRNRLLRRRDDSALLGLQRTSERGRGRRSGSERYCQLRAGG